MKKIEIMIDTFDTLGSILKNYNHSNNSNNPIENKLFSLVEESKRHNNWFTEQNMVLALNEWGRVLNAKNMKKWLDSYPSIDPEFKNPKKIGIVMAGNIPMVGFHDLLSVLLTGNTAILKLSSDDKIMIPGLYEILTEMNDVFIDRIYFTEGIVQKPDAVIATGSNNSARYFDYYFGKYPHIIRKNRHGVAVISGKEQEKELLDLGRDMFQYFGLGCRNISKIFVPKGYDFDHFFKGLFPLSEQVVQHSKYMNNYDYHRAIYLLNKDNILDNGFLLLKEDASPHSPVAVLHYEYYNDQNDLKQKLLNNADQVQCMVSSLKINEDTLDFGKSQQPELWDYADNIDTVEFLCNLN